MYQNQKQICKNKKKWVSIAKIVYDHRRIFLFKELAQFGDLQTQKKEVIKSSFYFKMLCIKTKQICKNRKKWVSIAKIAYDLSSYRVIIYEPIIDTLTLHMKVVTKL